MAVAQGDEQFEDVVEMDLQDVVRKIRGPKGTKVRLNVLRKTGNQTERFVVELIRDRVVLEEEAASIDYVDREINGKSRKIGLIYLPSFYADSRKGGRSAAKDMKRILVEANKQGLSAIVVDLAMNGGGSLDDAVEIAGLFFKTGNVVKQSQRAPERGEVTSADEDSTVDWAGPLVINISRVSASASEIVAGTLHDYKRAVIVGGDHTFGKGTVQQVSSLPQRVGALKTTIGMFFTAGGRSTQHGGVAADVVFPSVYSTDEIGEKNLDYSLSPKAIKSFLSPTAYVTTGPGRWDLITPEIVGNLRKKSTERIAKSAEFKKVQDEIKKSRERGKVVRVGDLLEESKEKEKENTKKPGDETKLKTVAERQAEKRENLLKRADIQEAINVAFDLSDELASPKVTVGQQSAVAPEKKEEAKQ
jgi:carboxyl-terminal processing protease